MFYLFFGSGLALFSLGLVVALETFRPLPQEVKGPFTYLAVFGFGQAVHQWLELRDFILFPSHTWPLLTIDISLFVLSSIFLLAFGIRLITKNLFLLYLPLLFFLLLWFSFFSSQLVILTSNEQIHLAAVAYGRWLLYLPANLIVAYAFLYGHAVKTLCHPLLANDRKFLASLFLANGFFNGLVAVSNKFAFFGLSEKTVNSYLGFSVEFFRAGIIIAISFVFFHTLRIFEHLFAKEMKTKEILERESFLAGQIQTQLISKEPLTFNNAFVCAEQVQAYQAGGDIYSYIPLNGELSLFVGDVSGKGVSSALLAALAVVILETQAQTVKQPDLACLRADRILKEKLPSGYFLTVIKAFYNPATRLLDVCSCGHPLPFYFKAKEQRWLEPPESSSLPIGLEFTYQPFKTKMQLEPGDKLLFFTDGLTDAVNLEGVRLELEGVLSWLEQHKELKTAELVLEIIAYAHSYSNYRLKDDVTVLVLEVIS